VTSKASPDPTTALPGEPDYEPDTSRPPYGWALLAGALVFALYAVTLAPTTAFWDTSEYIATAHILGIPHPPGNPLFVVLARTWEVLLAPFGLPVAVRVNLFSAFMSASAHALWFLVIHHVLRYFGTDRGFRLGGAFAAVMVSATAFTVWNQSNVNEKVYTVSLLTIALLSWLTFRWQERIGEGKDDNLLVLMAFILALSVGNHLMAFLAAPAVLVFILLVRPQTLFNWKLYPAIVAAGVVALTIHLFLPIRAGLEPVINEAAPRCDGIVGALASIVTYGNAGCEALSEALQRRQYDKPSIFSNPLNPETPRTFELVRAQFLNYLQYFDWQWSRSLDGASYLFGRLRIPFTMLFTGLGVWGAVEHHRRDRNSFWFFLVLFGTLSAGLVVYLNFKYGFSIPNPYDNFAAAEVRERDYFFVASFSVWGLWAGLGIAAIWRWLADDVVGSLAKASPALLVAAIPLVLNWPWADRSYDYSARDWAYNLLMSVEPYGVLFTNGDNDTFPLWYLQEVEGLRRDVTVIVVSYLNTPWYARQIRDLTSPCPEGVSATDDPTRILCQREYRPDDRAAYTTRPDTLPEGVTPLVLDERFETPDRSLLEIDEATIDQIGRTYSELTQARQLQLGPIQVALPAGMQLLPWQQYGFLIVRSALEDGRPVYFASSGNNSADLGLANYLVRQGLAFKLNRGPVAPEPPEGVLAMPPGSRLTNFTGDWVDVPRTRRLLEEVFEYRGGIPDWDHWPDHSTSGIPSYYAWAYFGLAQAAFERGDAEAVERYTQLGDAWQELASR